MPLYLESLPSSSSLCYKHIDHDTFGAWLIEMEVQSLDRVYIAVQILQVVWSWLVDLNALVYCWLQIDHVWKLNEERTKNFETLQIHVCYYHRRNIISRCQHQRTAGEFIQESNANWVGFRDLWKYFPTDRPIKSFARYRQLSCTIRLQ